MGTPNLTVWGSFFFCLKNSANGDGKAYAQPPAKVVGQRRIFDSAEAGDSAGAFGGEGADDGSVVGDAGDGFFDDGAELRR